jgi:hypothetical protein
VRIVSAVVALLVVLPTAFLPAFHPGRAHLSLEVRLAHLGTKLAAAAEVAAAKPAAEMSSTAARKTVGGKAEESGDRDASEQRNVPIANHVEPL